MASVETSTAVLRLFGDHLIPEEVSVQLGCEPSHSYRKGDTKELSSGTVVTRKTGMWLLETEDSAPEDIDAQVQALLGMLSTELAVWRAIGTQYEIELFCGLFMGTTNDGMSLTSTTLGALAARGISFTLDIYTPTIEPTA